MAALVVSIATLGGAPALAQERPGPGTVELSVIPGGGLFFVKSDQKSEPSFGNYDLGGAVAINFGRVGVEGEVAGSIGLTQTLEFATSPAASTRTPNMLSYTGNVIVPLAPSGRRSMVPYAAAGLGGLTLFEKPAVGLIAGDTFFTGNAGGGLKWYAGRWGLRVDYRFVAVQSKDEASSFFGRENRYGHRLYGGVIVNLVQ
jgi:hypothetical protein